MTGETPSVCWHRPGSRHRCRQQHEGAKLVYYGRCQSGRRWFWAAEHLGGDRLDRDRRHGWHETEEDALDAAQSAVAELAAGDPAVAVLLHGFAASILRMGQCRPAG